MMASRKPKVAPKKKPAQKTVPVNVKAMKPKPKKRAKPKTGSPYGF
jgi:hypothetical protein